MLQRAKRLLPPGPRKVPLGLGRGVRMHVDFSQTSRHYLGLYEIEVSRYIKTVCRPGAVCFDVGGSHGYDALVFAKLTGARVVTFEPVTTDLLRSNLALNPDLEPLVTVVPEFVGDGLPIDRYVEESGIEPDVIKIDVDGPEATVLKSAEWVLSGARKPALVIETHSPEAERECGRLLLEYGYEPRIKHQRTILPDLRMIPHNRWLIA